MQQNGTRRIEDGAQLGGNGDPLETVQEIKKRNTLVVILVRYSGPFFKKGGIQTNDSKNKEIEDDTPRDDIVRFYMSRKDEGEIL